MKALPRPAVITIGTIHAGSAFNIIPETVEMQGPSEIWITAEASVSNLRRIQQELATGIASAMGWLCDVQVFMVPTLYKRCHND